MATRTIPHDDLEALVDSADVRPKGEKEAVEKVLAFLEELALEKDDGDVDVHLVQQSRGSGVMQNVTSFTIRAGEDLSESAQQIVDDAVRDARDGAVSGKVRYAVTASGRRGRRSFTLTFPSTGEDDFDETPNERGALSQTMRMNEQLLRSLLDAFHDVTRTQKTIIEQLSKNNQKHEELAGKNWQAYGDLMTAHHERQLALTKAERGERRMDEVAGFLMTAGQVVFNTFLGKRVFANAPTPLEHLTYATMSQFTQEQAQAMVSGQPLVMSAEQALGLHKLFASLDDAYKQRRAEEPPPPAAYAPKVEVTEMPRSANVNGHHHTPPAGDPASAAM